MEYSKEELDRMVQMDLQERAKIVEFMSKHKTNEDIIEGIYYLGQDHVSVAYLKEVGFDGSQLTGKIVNQESPMFSKSIFDDFSIGDFECIHERDGFRIVKTDFSKEFSLIKQIKGIKAEKESIESTLWAYRFDFDMKNAEMAKIYEQKKEAIDKVYEEVTVIFDMIEESLKRTQDYVTEVRKSM
jgi:hypothetical protein